MTERRSDVARAVKAGDIGTEDANTVHRFKNTTNTPCVFWTMSLLKKQAAGSDCLLACIGDSPTRWIACGFDFKRGRAAGR